MDEKQNYERCDVDNDYEGVEQIGDEYFYRSKKQKHQQTAEDRLYGVFADSDSEGEGRGKKRSRKPADFSKPVGFVSSGITQDTTQKPEDVIKSERQTMPAAASTGLGAHAGLGAGAGLGASPGLGASGGLGFTSQQPPQDQDMQEEQESLLPTAFGQRYSTCCCFQVACKAYFCERPAVPFPSAPFCCILPVGAGLCSLQRSVLKHKQHSARKRLSKPSPKLVQQQTLVNSSSTPRALGKRCLRRWGMWQGRALGPRVREFPDLLRPSSGPRRLGLVPAAMLSTNCLWRLSSHRQNQR